MSSSPDTPPNGTGEPNGSASLEWTGERYLPWIPDAAIAYEHLHRYSFASRLTAGKRVLDLACGEGYGTNMLAAMAASVVGIEVDEVAVRHARRKYTRDNLEFVAGSVTGIPLHEDHAFDVAVCFEAIEHIAEQELLVGEAHRMLKHDGIFVVSTPNGHIYRHETHGDNAFHVRELEFEQFRALLGKFFKRISFFGQRTLGSSSIWPLDRSGGLIEESLIVRGGCEYEFTSSDQREPMYFIAIASNGSLRQNITGSVLIDASNQLLTQNYREIRELLQTKDANEKGISWFEVQVAERSATIESLKEGVEWCQNQIRALTEANEWKDKLIQDARATIAANEEGVAWLRGVAQNLEVEKQNLMAHNQDLNGRLRDAMREFELIHASRGWRLILWLRRLRGIK